MPENKSILAATLKYDENRDVAPRVTAKGRGLVAEKIIALAKKHGIPIKSDPSLVNLLSKLDIDEQIPTELYRVVAEILAFVYSVNSAKREQ